MSTPIFRSIVRFRTINVTKVLQNLNIGGKVLFSGVFDTSSILQYRGMVMDENGRNGRKWHLAQQITYLVTKPHIMQLSMTQPVTFTYNQI